MIMISCCRHDGVLCIDRYFQSLLIMSVEGLVKDYFYYIVCGLPFLLRRTERWTGPIRASNPANGEATEKSNCRKIATVAQKVTNLPPSKSP